MDDQASSSLHDYGGVEATEEVWPLHTLREILSI